MMKEWKITYGGQEIPISSKDLEETLGRAIGFAYWKLENDEKIKGHVQMKIIHEMDIQILELLRAQFAGAVEESRKRHVHMRVVKKRPAGTGHLVKGKPGDLVEVTPKEEKS